MEGVRDDEIGVPAPSEPIFDRELCTVYQRKPFGVDVPVVGPEGFHAELLLHPLHELQLVRSIVEDMAHDAFSRPALFKPFRNKLKIVFLGEKKGWIQRMDGVDPQMPAA